MIRFFFKCKMIFDKYSKDEVGVYAAQASFFIILSAFPFLMLLLSMIQLVPLVRVSDLLTVIVDAVPESLDAVVIRIVESLYSDSPMALFSVTALAALWSSSKGMLSIENGLNRIYGISNQRPYLIRRLVCTGYTIIFTVMCVLCLVLLVFGDTIYGVIMSTFPAFYDSAALILSIRELISVPLLILFFLAVYTVLPYRKQDIRFQLPGAVVSAVGWTAFSRVFSIYFRYFSTLAITYGSLTAVILFMLWVYFCLCILFIGAEINCFHS